MRRSVRLSLAALAAAALVSSSQVVSVAAPAPSPQPTAGSPRREAARKMTGAPAKSSKASKPDFGKAPKHPDLGGASTPLKRLIRDWDSGRLTRQGARKIASEMMGVALKRDGAKVASRYKGRLDVDDLVALSGLAGPSTSDAPAKVEPQYGSGPGCDLDCVVTSEHFNFWYWPGRQSADDLADRDGNGIPDRAENTLETLEDAWTYFHVDLASIFRPAGFGSL